MKVRVAYLTAIALLTILALPTTTRAQENKQKLPHYNVIDLGTLGGTYSGAGGISNSGWVEGWTSLSGDNERAFLWRKGVTTDLGTLGGPNSDAGWRPSERGEAGGGSDTTTPDANGEDYCGYGTYLICHPFVWRDGVMTPLPTLGGNNGYAAGVNNRGQVVGNAEYDTPDPTCELPYDYLQIGAVVWENGKIIKNLKPLPGDPDAAAFAINDWGQVTGVSGGCSIPPFHAVLWQNGKAIDLGNFGGTTSEGIDINSLGEVVGVSYLSDNTTYYSFLWRNGVMTNLGTVPGDVSSEADGLNDWGQVVGGSYDANGNNRAYIWQNGVMTDLNTLIPSNSPLYLLEANGGINDRGQIVGTALQISSGEVHGFLATPGKWSAADENATVSRTVPKVTVPENVRKQLQRRTLLRGLKRGLLGQQ